MDTTPSNPQQARPKEPEPAETPVSTAARTLDETLFRQEALAQHVRGYRQQGSVLQLSPRWIPKAFRWMLLILVAAGFAVLMAPADEYATGQFVLRTEGKVELSAPIAGMVTALEADNGQAVKKGQIVARFYDARETAELERIHLELRQALIRRLRWPSDKSTELPLSRLRAELQLAEKQLEQRCLRSPIDGRISELKVASGRHLSAGEAVMSVVGDRQKRTVIASLPGHFRPLIRENMPMRLELEGFRDTYQFLTVDRVSEEVLGPAEVRRLVGHGDMGSVQEPVVLVFAVLPDESFESGGRSYSFHDGMRGLAEVRVRTDGLLTSLFPMLNRVKSWGRQP